MRRRTFQKIQIARILRWVGLCLIFVIILCHIITKLWFGPAYVEMQVKRSLSNSWSGPVTVGDIEFNYSGMMFLHNVLLYDNSGKEVMRAEGVTLVLCKWPSLNAPARIIDVQRFYMYLNLEGGKFDLPFRHQQNTGKPDYLESMTLRRSSLIINDSVGVVVADNLFAEYLKVKEGYELNITSGKQDGENELRVKSSFGNNGEITIDLKLNEKANLKQTASFLKAVNVPMKWGCEGKINAELHAKGNSSDINSLWPKGIVEFNDWSILENNKVVAKDFNGVLLVEQRHLNLKKFGGVFFDGDFNSSLYVDIKNDGPAAFGGKIRATDIDLTKFTEFWETEKRFTRGTGLLSLAFAGDMNGIDNLRGNGAVYINDADLWRFPVIGEIFKVIGIWGYRLGGMSDLIAYFNLKGTRINLQRGQLSNTFSAIEVERGGEINLSTGQLDMYVVGLGLSGIDKVINKLPVINWIARFKDKIVRLHIKGQWSKPVITKEPLTDVKEATVVFFKSIIESGGKISNTVKEGLGTVIEK
jgi:hypothetical protein